MKTARRTVLFFLTGLAPLLSSCALFEEEKTPELQPEELIRIALPHWKKPPGGTAGESHIFQSAETAHSRQSATDRPILRSES